MTSSIGIGSLFRTGVTAMIDSMGSTFPRAAVAALEDESQSKVKLARQCLIDEGPEIFWKTIIGSLFVKTMRIVAPVVPEQIANFPGEMLGAYIHWWSASYKSKNAEAHREIDKNIGKESGAAEKSFNKFVTKPIHEILKMVGLDDEIEKNVNFATFGIIQAGLFLGGTYVLRNAEEENIPGMNLDYEDPWYISLSKTLGYTVFEQITHLSSQTMRYCMDYKQEFNGNNENKFNKNVLAKALANVINERAIPGNIPSAIAGCLSTLFLGRFIPKSVAGAIGETPMKGLERLLTLHRRRSTKDKYDETSANKRADNFRGHKEEWFRNILKIADDRFDRFRNFLINNIVVRIFKPEDKSVEQFIEELEGSYNLRIDLLKDKTEKHDEEKRQRELKGAG